MRVCGGRGSRGPSHRLESSLGAGHFACGVSWAEGDAPPSHPPWKKHKSVISPT